MTEQSVGLGTTVRAVRRARGLTLRALAAELGVSPGTMSAIENGKVAVTVGRLNEVSAVLGVPVADLVDPLSVPIAAPTPVGGPDWRTYPPLPLDPVLAATVDVFADTGYHGATMRLVAAAADLSVAGIYRYHRSKQRLLVALIDAWFDDLLWRIEAAAGSADSPGRAFAELVRVLVRGQVQRRELAFIVETELRSLDEPDRGRIGAIRRGVQRRFVDMAQAAVDAGEFGTEAPAAGARAVVSLCLAVPFRLDGEVPPAADVLADEYAALALAMMGAVVQ
ncbi:putative TetR family transcriptional regulator [Gordonia hirsuta DSM 44140 = NBRC 16056]|uniref:Putative TetR family transcriptional regulator n=1 Tax=Gordonia hirsuta DSM 44140 = NBRC 16056 TaxID=1121927 RepID=L7LAD5_9ACTN|nr:TetR family transcriptional regulator [Gordonia hirsuta]GAC56973.1 putative TetR family transcriptional regulator [Gordonia hirsuta DSM 44140 = NBRC 16056]